MKHVSHAGPQPFNAVCTWLQLSRTTSQQGYLSTSSIEKLMLSAPQPLRIALLVQPLLADTVALAARQICSGGVLRQLLRQEHACVAIMPMLSMPGRWRQQGVAYTAQPGAANTAQPACLVNGLVGAGATQLPWPVGSQDHHGHLALGGLDHSWQQVGHSCARAGNDGGRSSADTDWWMNRSWKDNESGAPSCPMSVAQGFWQ